MGLAVGKDRLVCPCSPLAQTLRVPKVVSDQEGVQVEVTRLLVSSYFDIVRKNLQVSMVPVLAGVRLHVVEARSPSCHIRPWLTCWLHVWMVGSGSLAHMSQSASPSQSCKQVVLLTSVAG